MMDLDELRTVQAGERSTDSLQSLRDSFYRDVAEYINGLREERARAAERADDPFGSEEVRHLTDEIETAQEVAEAIYDRRLGKVVKRASLAAAGMPTDEEGLTDEEAALFAEVIGEIESRRDAVLSAFAGETEMPAADPASDPGEAGISDEDTATADPSSANRQPTEVSARSGRETGANERADPPPAPDASADGPIPEPDPTHEDDRTPDTDPVLDVDTDTGTGFDASQAMGAGTGRETAPGNTRGGDQPDAEEDRERPDPEGPTPDGGRLAADRATVRITRDVGEIMGVDEHVYDLADGDVVTLPSANAEPLLERDAASRIE